MYFNFFYPTNIGAPAFIEIENNYSDMRYQRANEIKAQLPKYFPTWFGECVVVTACWRTLGLQNVVADCVAVAYSASSYLFGILNRLDGDARLEWGMTLWSIWASRNQH